MIDIASLNFDKGSGLVTVVARDDQTGALLMVAHANREALEKSVESGEMHYYSRTRGLWHKGATSGNTQRVISLNPDCDGDVVLAVVQPRGPACHTGEYSCFGEVAVPSDALRDLDGIIAQRADALRGGTDQERVGGSYTQRLLSDRNLRLKKIGEEAAELIAACADSDAGRAVEEAADLLYHMAVALNAAGATLDDVRRTLAARSR
jgi:phosphoribosyl-ATP pyrophosphohydrolase/phosphoribosyl-AMP cyclohydrolase